MNSSGPGRGAHRRRVNNEGVDTSVVILALVVVTALAFDFTNGFHDTGNAMATSIATGALKPKVAVALSAVLNLVGAFLSVEVALTVTNAVVSIQNKDGTPKEALLADGGQNLLLIVLAGLVGGIVWNLFTWLYGLPSSSSHALLGGLVGSTLAGLGVSGVKWTGDGTKLDGVVGKILLPALISSVIAIAVATRNGGSPVLVGAVATIGTWLIFKITAGVAQRFQDAGFRWGQVGSASLVSLAHGTNDAQKTMGVMTLALIASGHWDDTKSIPIWVKLSAALAIALGTYIGGWRIIRTLGKGLIEISPAQGMAAESSSAAVILSSSHLGFTLSAWAITLPSAGLVGALMFWLGDGIGGAAGAIVVFLILAGLSTWMWMRSRHAPIGAHNVNDEWEPDVAPVEARRSHATHTEERP